MDIHLTRRTIGTSSVLDVSGELDLATVPRLHSELTAIIAQAPGTVVAVDMDGVTAFDDCALGVLLGAAGRAREAGGDVVLVCNDERVRERFATLRFDRAIDLIRSTSEMPT